MNKGKSKLFFGQNIKPILDSTQESTLFLLLSMNNDKEKSNIYDVIKVPNKNFKKDFQELLIYFLPYGIRIVGSLLITEPDSNLSDSHFKTTNISNHHSRLSNNNSHYASDTEDPISFEDTISSQIGVMSEFFFSNQSYLISESIFFIHLKISDKSSAKSISVNSENFRVYSYKENSQKEKSEKHSEKSFEKVGNSNEGGFKFNPLLTGKVEQLVFKDLSFNLFKDYVFFSLNSIDFSMQIDQYYTVSDAGYIERLFDHSNLKLKDLNKVVDHNKAYYSFLDKQKEEENLLNQNEQSELITNNVKQTRILQQLKKRVLTKKHESLQSKWEEFFSKEGVDEYFSNNREIPLSLVLSSSITGTDFEETNNTFISLSQKLEGEVLKQIRFNLVYILPRSELNLSLDLFENIREYFFHMISHIYHLNTTTTYSYSLYLYNKNRFLPYNVLYNRKEKYDELEEGLFSQRKYFMEIHSLDKSDVYYPILKTQQLEGYNRERLQIIEEEYPSFKNKMGPSSLLLKESRFLLSPHKEIFYDIIDGDFEREIVFSKGDFIFYHSGLHGAQDRLWSKGYRCLQSLISWLNLNGHINIEVPTITTIQELLVFLGEKKTAFINSSQPLEMQSIAVVISFYIDIEIDILNFKNFKEFEKNKEIVKNHLSSVGSPVLIDIETPKSSPSSKNHLDIKSIFALNIKEEKIGILDHDYSGSNSLLHLKKSKYIVYDEIQKIFIQEESDYNNKVSILLVKPPVAI
mmetsp:Transcript_3461/g.3488  ORF Transcript_3461/g.3488 Transcript_3461/m.3488 type:complete len:747 (-) Transcript_3461:30-2270(-)